MRAWLPAFVFTLGAAACASSEPTDARPARAGDARSVSEASEPGGVITGNAVGQRAADWVLAGATGEAVHLHDFAGRIIFFESGAQW